MDALSPRIRPSFRRAAALGLVLVIAGGGAVWAHEGLADKNAQFVPGHGLTKAEFDTAVTIAREQQHSAHGKHVRATVSPIAGPKLQSNTGHRCTSQHLLRILLTGTFKDISTGDDPAEEGSTSDGGTTTLKIAADPVTKQACMISYITAPVQPPAHALTLFSDS